MKTDLFPSYVMKTCKFLFIAENIVLSLVILGYFFLSANAPKTEEPQNADPKTIIIKHKEGPASLMACKSGSGVVTCDHKDLVIVPYIPKTDEQN